MTLVLDAADSESAELEAAFHAWREGFVLTQARSLAVLTSVANLSFVALDWFARPEHQVDLVTWRLGFMETCFLLGVVLAYSGRGRATLFVLAFGMQAGVALLTAVADGPADLYVAGIYLAMGLSAVFIPAHIVGQVLVFAASIGVFCVAHTVLGHPIGEIGQQAFILSWFGVGAALSIQAFTRQKCAEIAASLQLSQALGEVEQASRAKSSFLASMSHELRTPLNGILGYAELLLEEVEDPIVQEDLRRIETSGHHLLALVNDVLDMSKVAAGQMEVRLEDVRLAPLLEALVPMCAPLVTKNGNTLSVSGDHTVRADPQRLTQILMNLVSNAAKFTENGQIEIVVEGSRVHVRDTGCGMNDAQQAALFQAFSQVHDASRQVGGTGLGLALSREFAVLMEGDVTVVSEPGLGSTFTVHLVEVVTGSS